MFITGVIINKAYYSNYDDDQSPGTPPRAVVMAVLFSVMFLELVLACAIRAAFTSRSAPSAPDTASTGTSSNESGNSGGSSLPVIFQRMRSVQLSSLLPAASSARSGPQYQPLLSEEDYEEGLGQHQTAPIGSAEMTVMHATAPPSSAVTTIPVVVTPLQYAPSNVQSSISML